MLLFPGTETKLKAEARKETHDLGEKTLQLIAYAQIGIKKEPKFTFMKC